LGIKVPCREPWENKSFNGGNTSWQPRRKPPRKRNTKRTDARSENPQSPSREAPLEGLFLSQDSSCQRQTGSDRFSAEAFSGAPKNLIDLSLVGFHLGEIIIQ